jgi:cytochrome c oxidase cbb3-type subunit 3
MNPNKEVKPELRAHVYDGIQEFDQKLPNWWLFTLYIAIVFFVVYWLVYYGFRVAPGDAERLDPVVEKIRTERMEAMLAMLNDDTLGKLASDPSVLAEGERIYQQTCLACHGPNRGGKSEGPIYIGASLADTEWRYGGKPTEIYKMVFDGTPDPVAAQTRGEIPMPGQGLILGPEKVASVTAFILSHHRSAP